MRTMVQWRNQWFGLTIIFLLDFIEDGLLMTNTEEIMENSYNNLLLRLIAFPNLSSSASKEILSVDSRWASTYLYANKVFLLPSSAVVKVSRMFNVIPCYFATALILSHVVSCFLLPISDSLGKSGDAVFQEWWWVLIIIGGKLMCKEHSPIVL